MRKNLSAYFFIFLLIGILCFSFSEGDEGYFVYLKGKKQYVLVEGKGEPSIILINGKGRTHKDFNKIIKKLKNKSLVFGYDRAGLGQSEYIKGDRRVDTMAWELHELLVKEKIKPPYILVGHSMGTYIARCFENMYPQKVKSMVFIEPAYEEEFKYSLSIRPDSEIVVLKSEFKTYMKDNKQSKGQIAENKKAFDFDSLGYSTNQKIVKNIGVPKATVSLILSLNPDIENNFIEKEMENRLLFFKDWQTKNASIFVTTTHKSGYFIQKDEPDLVVDEILKLIR